MPNITLTTATIPPCIADCLKELGRIIKRGQKRLGLRHCDFAKKIGISPVTLRRVERGSPTTAIAAYFMALHAIGTAEQLSKCLSDECARYADTACAHEPEKP